MTAIDRQLAREAAMLEKGRARAQTQIDKALQGGRAAETPAGVALAKRAVAPLSQALREFLDVAFSGKAGRRHAAATLLKDVDPDLAAFLTVKVGLSKAAQKATLKNTAISIGNALAEELLAAEFEKKEEALYKAVIRNAQIRGMSSPRIAKAVVKASREFSVVEDLWTPTQRLVVGSKLVELMAEHLGLVEIGTVRESTKTSTRSYPIVDVTPKVMEWMREYNAASTLMRPVLLPTAIPPQPWEGGRGSPYYGTSIKAAAIITRSFPGQLEALEASHMPTVLNSLNALQETPWRINQRVLAVMEQAWEMDAGLPCLPPREDQEIPESPPEVVNDVRGGEHRKAWRQIVRRIYEANTSSRSKRFEFARTLAIAQDYREEEKLYFPHRLDFRGRCYAAATSLSPQGADNSKGLLEFAEGKPIGDRGLFWLGVHGANLFGNDKVSLEERYQWALENVNKAAQVNADPLTNLWWTEADSPWCFLAWC